MNAVQQLLTGHIDIWTAADTGKRSGRGRASGNAGSVYGIKKLRELILELAVRGKLVPQDSNDEPASKLLKRIQAEKAKLTAEGKIRKDKPLPPIAEEEKQFNLPSGWHWVRFSDYASDIATGPFGSMIHQSDYVQGGVPLINPSHMIGDKIAADESVSVSKAMAKALDSYAIYEGDIVMARRGEVGRVALVTKNENGWLCGTGSFVLRFCTDVCRDYLRIFFRCDHARTYLAGEAVGTTMVNLNHGILKKMPMAMPPIGEQHRIVAKVDELMTLCDQLEAQHTNATEAHEKLVSHLLGTLTQSQSAEDFNANWQRIAVHFDTLFTTEASIDALKQTLLQLAVMGKLVPQDANDEPASELLKRILKERNRQIEHEGSRTIAGDAIQSLEMYIAIPSGWQYCRLGNLARFIDYRGKTPNKVKSGVPLITAKNVRYGYISREPEEFVTAEEYKSWMTRGFPRIGDMLFTTEAPLGNIALIGIAEEFALAQRVICFQLHERAIGEYLKIAIMSDQVQQQLINAATGMTATGIKASKLKEIPIPIPSIAEQHRIVAKVDEIVALCDQLRTRIIAANQSQQKIADVMVEQAVT